MNVSSPVDGCATVKCVVAGLGLGLGSTWKGLRNS